MKYRTSDKIVESLHRISHVNRKKIFWNRIKTKEVRRKERRKLTGRTMMDKIKMKGKKTR